VPARGRRWLHKELIESEPVATPVPIEKQIATLAGELMASGRLHEVRPYLEQNGIHLLRADYYAPVPTLTEIDSSWERRGDGMPYRSPALYDNEKLLSFMADALAPHVAEFSPPSEPVGDEPQFYWNNPMFSHVDAIVYNCFVRYLRPRRIVEIGGGFSSMIAASALATSGGGELFVVEPYPTDRLRSLPGATLIEKPVQDVPVAFFADALQAGDVLFIDSTHTVKCGGDCPYIYLQILPALARGVVIHAHDIYLPGMMPERWRADHRMFWAEQYLLQAYLLDNPRVEVLFGTRYHQLVNPDRLLELTAGKAWPEGASFWFRV